jgi:hypothetical protein
MTIQTVANSQKNTQETCLKTILRNVGKRWIEFYKYVKRCKGNRENIPAIKDCNGHLITDTTEKANSLNFYYSSVFSSKHNIQQIQGTNTGEPFAVKTKIIRKRLAATEKKKSIGPANVSGEILKPGGEAIISYLARLLDITINNAAIPRNTVVPIYKGGD